MIENSVKKHRKRRHLPEYFTLIGYCIRLPDLSLGGGEPFQVVK